MIRLVTIMVTWILTLLKTFQFLAVIRITLDITIAEYAGIAKCRSASNACAAEVGEPTHTQIKNENLNYNNHNNNNT